MMKKYGSAIFLVVAAVAIAVVVPFLRTGSDPMAQTPGKLPAVSTMYTGDPI